MTAALCVIVAGFAAMLAGDVLVDVDRHPRLKSAMIVGGAVVILGGLASMFAALRVSPLALPPP